MRFSSKLLKKCEKLCRADQTITSLAEPPGLGKDGGRSRMNMKILDLTEQNLGKAPEWEAYPFSCKYCLYWEYPELSFDPAAGVSEGEFSKKLAWLRRVRKEWGSCGKLLFVGNEVVGYAQYAPARFLPGAREYPAGPVSEDAVLLACLFIPKPKFRGKGLGSLLLEAILEELSARGIQAVETFARRGSAENPSGPVEFYLRHGFSVLRDDPEFPLLRRDLIPH
jgi:GNAT superfamily N-acetyltransferase